jgi:hypothetical protein
MGTTEDLRFILDYLTEAPDGRTMDHISVHAAVLSVKDWLNSPSCPLVDADELEEEEEKPLLLDWDAVRGDFKVYIITKALKQDIKGHVCYVRSMRSGWLNDYKEVAR